MPELSSSELRARVEKVCFNGKSRSCKRQVSWGNIWWYETKSWYCKSFISIKPDVLLMDEPFGALRFT